MREDGEKERNLYGRELMILFKKNGRIRKKKKKDMRPEPGIRNQIEKHKN